MTFFGVIQPGFAYETGLSSIRITRPYIYRITGGRAESYIFGSYHYGLSINQLPQWLLDLHDRTQIHYYEMAGNARYAQAVVPYTQKLHFDPESLVPLLKEQAAGRKNDPETSARLVLFGAPEVLAPYLLEETSKTTLDACSYILFADLFFAQPYQSLDDELRARSYINRKNVASLDSVRIREDADKAAGTGSACKVRSYTALEAIKNRDIIQADILEYAEGIADQTPKKRKASVEYRNQAWAKSLGQILIGNSIFITVGVNHLNGEMGLINLLKAQGYEVERIESVTQARR